MDEYTDISFLLNDNIVTYPGNPKFHVKKNKANDVYSISEISMGSHTGTHIDAPSHFFPNKTSISDINLNILNGTARIIEFLSKDLITEKDIESFEITQGERIILKTKNTDVFDCKELLEEYITIDYNAAMCLVAKKVKLVGIDYLTIELPRHMRKPGLSVHKILLDAGIVVLEGLNLAEATAGTYELICMPLKIENCDGSPVRAVLKNTNRHLCETE